MIDQAKIMVASRVLAKLISSLKEFDNIFNALSPQEKYVVGGIVFRLRNIWTDERMIGVIAPPDVARDMIEELIAFSQNPRLFSSVESKRGLILTGKNEN